MVPRSYFARLCLFLCVFVSFLYSVDCSTEKESHSLFDGWTVPSSSNDKFSVIVGDHDRVVDDATMDVLLDYVLSYWTWRYIEPHQTKSNERGIWIANYSPSLFRQSRVLRAINTFVHQSHNDSSLELESVCARAVQRGDINHIEHANGMVGSDAFVLLMFLNLNKTWGKNDGGELILWDKDGTLLTVVHPKYGRMATFPSEFSLLYKPPSIATTATQIIIQMSFASKDISKVDVEMFRNDDVVKNEFPLPIVTSALVIDIESHITRRYYSAKGLSVTILDNIFSREDLDILRNFVLDNGTYNFDLSVDSADNVKWVTGYEVDEFTKSRIWVVAKQVVDHITKRSDYYPYDVTCNLIRGFDHPEIHTDCEPEQDEYTFLVYLNPNCTADWQGETSFFEENGELFASIRPRYGRIALFHGAILHSGHPFSLLYSQARLTFAIKMLPKKEANEYLKQELLESIEGIIDLVTEEEKQQLKKAMRSVEEGSRNLEWLDEMFRQVSVNSENVLRNKL